VRNGRLDLIVVGYLRLMRAQRPTGNRVEDGSAFSRRLKQLARDPIGPSSLSASSTGASSGVPG
jgi:replicative DNA helicase